ncbi:MAG: hypothetical protein V1892_01415 [bacterium]
MKEFFKPTKFKIVLFLLLLILGIVAGMSGVCPPYTKCPPPSIFQTALVAITLVGPALHVFMTTSLGTPIAFLMLVVYYYTISSLVILIYDKSRRKI